MNAQVLLTYGTSMDTGYGEPNVMYTSYIRFLPADLKPYAGATITRVRIGLLKSSPNVTLYIKQNPADRKPLYTQKLGSLQAGWNEVTLTTPLALTATDTLTIGYKAGFVEGGGVALSQVDEKYGAVIYNATTKQWDTPEGSLCLQAVVEGENLPATEIAMCKLYDVTAGEADSAFTLMGTVRNAGTQAISNYTVQYSMSGGSVYKRTFNHALPVNGIDTFKVRLATPAPGSYELSAHVVAVNGEPDSYDGNNSATALLRVRMQSFQRKVVFEEGTGTWCGNCPRGMVAMERCKKRFPGTFIPISVHSGDAMQISTDYQYNYSALLSQFQGYPCVMVNRETVTDIDTASAVQICQYYSNLTSEIGCTASASLNADSTEVTCNATLQSNIDMNNPDYRVAFVVTEDGVTGYDQENYYNNNQRGPLDGWENKPELVTDAVFDDVARALSSYSGADPGFTSLKVNEPRTFSLTLPLPQTIQHKGNLHVIALILSSKGRVVNAATCRPTGAVVNGISAVNTQQAHHGYTYYTIGGAPAGHNASELTPGLYIVRTPQGKVCKMIINR